MKTYSPKYLCGSLLVFVCLANLSMATVVDLTTVGSSGIINNAIFNQVNPDSAGGTGVFESFLRVQANGQESGYNTDGTLEFDSKVGTWTHALQLSAVPVLNINGVAYREFCLDVNQGSPGLISLDAMKIHVESSSTLSGYPTNFSAPVYDLDAGQDNWVKMDYSLNSGSGRADVALYVPSSLFGTDNSKYVYLYTEFGQNFSTDDGFEEWGVGASSVPITPEPATIGLLIFGSVALVLRRR